MPPIGDPSECAHHDLKMGGGLPTLAGVRAEDAADDLEPGAPLPLKDAGPGYAALGSSGYADDTQEGPWARPPSRGRSPQRRSGCRSLVRTSAWTNLARGSRGNRAPRRSCSGESRSRWRRGSRRITGLVLSRRLEAGRSALRRLPHLSTYDRRERAISTLITPEWPSRR